MDPKRLRGILGAVRHNPWHAETMVALADDIERDLGP
jgi:hypothetical protein